MSEIKNKTISFRLTPSEKEKLNELIEQHKVKNISDFIRQIILTGKFKTTKQAQNYERLLYEINKIGNNINQIAKLCNIEKQIDIKALEELAKIEEELSILLEECK